LIEQWEAQYGHRPNIETLQRLSGLSKAAIEGSVVVGRIKYIRSLDQAAKDDSETALGDLLSDPFAQSPNEYCEAEEAKRQVQAVLGQLPEADRQILERTYMNGETLKTVAADMNTSRETIRQRQIKALKRTQQIVEIANTLNLQIA
jgi:RNA polymerase sigma factor (sigma-70 family)